MGYPSISFVALVSIFVLFGSHGAYIGHSWSPWLCCVVSAVEANKIHIGVYHTKLRPCVNRCTLLQVINDPRVVLILTCGNMSVESSRSLLRLFSPSAT